MNDFLIIVAVCLAVLGNSFYFFKVIKKEVEPHPFTWFVWSVVSAVTFLGAWQKGGGSGVIPIFASEIFTIIIFLFSLKYGFKKIEKNDKYFLVICLLGLIPWFLTSDPTISVITVVCVDLFAFIPTLQKAYKFPKSETAYLYLSNVLRHILILFTLATINTATSLHSFVMIIVNALMVFILIYRSQNRV